MRTFLRTRAIWIGTGAFVLTAAIAVAQESNNAESAGAPSAVSGASTAPRASSAKASEQKLPGGETTAGASDARRAAPSPHSLRFQFHGQPWKEVLEWFARQADLSLVMDSPPPGTFNYTDSREYSPAEAIDLINSVLLTKGYTLVRRDRMLMLVNLEDGVPPWLVQTVSADDLGKRGEFELVRVLFNLEKFKPEEAEAEVKKLLGPQGSVTALTKSRQLQVVDTVGHLRAVRAVIDRVEKPEGAGSGSFKTLELKYVRVDDVMPIVRQLLDIPEDKMAGADIRIAVEPRLGRLLFITGAPEKVGRVIDIIQELDIPSRGRVRTFPMSAEGAKAAVDRIETVWPTLRANKLRVITAPPAADNPPAPANPEAMPSNPSKSPENRAPPAAKKPKNATTMQRSRGPLRSAGMAASETRRSNVWGARIEFVAEPVAESPAAGPRAGSKEPPPVIVMVGPNGLTVISDDPAALDEFERLLGAAAPPESNGPTLPVFYLKYAKAATVAESLERIFSGGASSSSTSKEGEPGESAATTGAEGPVSRLATGPIRIIPDVRLNALMVQANHTDLEKIAQVLRVLDMKESPEDVSVTPKPRMIPVVHTKAQEVADVIREVYADKMITPYGLSPNQVQLFERLGGRGGRGGRGGGGFGGFGGFGEFGAGGGNNGGGGGGNQAANRRDEANRIGVGVDARTNSLVVSATDPEFEEIKQLVGELDVAAADEGSAVQVIALHQTSAEAMERALYALAGDGVQINHGGPPTNGEQPAAGSTNTSTAPQEPAWMQRATQERNRTSTSTSSGGQSPYPRFGGFNGGFNGGGPGGYPGGGFYRRFGRGGGGGGGGPPGQGSSGGR